MKKIYSIIAIAACAFTAQQASAQKFVVYNTNGQQVEYSTAEVDSIVFVPAQDNPNPYNHEYVDLGLPSGTKWAKYNIGASADDPEAIGDYFAWGEIAPKTSFRLDNYKFYDADTQTYTKYNATDGKTSLDPEDDAATQLWGSGWSIPSEEDWVDLFNNCINIDMKFLEPRLGQHEYAMAAVFTGPNGNTLTIPGQGYYTTYDDGTEELVYESTGYTMAFAMKDNSVTVPSEGSAPVFIFGQMNLGWASVKRCDGVNIRAVYKEKK